MNSILWISTEQPIHRQTKHWLKFRVNPKIPNDTLMKVKVDCNLFKMEYYAILEKHKSHEKSVKFNKRKVIAENLSYRYHKIQKTLVFTAFVNEKLKAK